MEFLIQLWLPILVAGVVVFFLSALVWTALPFHRKDWRGLPNEEAVLAALRENPPAPGQYALPYLSDPKLREDPAFKERVSRGPTGFITVTRTGMPAMGPMMAKSLVFNLIASLLFAYVAWHALGAGADFMAVFRIVGATATMSYVLAMAPESIWFGRPWRTFGIQVVDAILFGLATGAIFAWLWPR